MNSKINKELSYFKLTLLAFLYESHPELLENYQLINTRGDLAAETYSQAIENGHTHNEAEELANEALYKGLHFSKFDTLVNILWNVFVDFIPFEDAKEYATKLLPECEKVFSKFPLSDEFAYSRDFEQLCTELTKTINLWIEENELQ